MFFTPAQPSLVSSVDNASQSLFLRTLLPPVGVCSWTVFSGATQGPWVSPALVLCAIVSLYKMLCPFTTYHGVRFSTWSVFCAMALGWNIVLFSPYLFFFLRYLEKPPCDKRLQLGLPFTSLMTALNQEREDARLEQRGRGWCPLGWVEGELSLPGCDGIFLGSLWNLQ